MRGGMEQLRRTKRRTKRKTNKKDPPCMLNAWGIWVANPVDYDTRDGCTRLGAGVSAMRL